MNENEKKTKYFLVVMVLFKPQEVKAGRQSVDILPNVVFPGIIVPRLSFS